MRTSIWIASAALVAGGVIVGPVLNGGTSADAASTIRVTPTQLQINQRISQAAVRRSNEALVLLAPIRPDAKQPNKVLGWTTRNLRDAAVTTPKLADGAVTAAKLAAGTAGAPTAVISRFRSGQVAVPLTASSLGHLDLPAGNWVILAKGYATTTGTLRTVTCTLQAGTDSDQALAGAVNNSPVSLSLQVPHTFGAAGSVDLSCSAPAPGGLGTNLNGVRLTAIRADTLASTPQS
jgi:hypothetical protein